MTQIEIEPLEARRMVTKYENEQKRVVKRLKASLR